MSHRWHFFNYFFRLRLPYKSLCFRCFLTLFFLDTLFFNEWWIGLDWRSPGFQSVEFNKEINLVSIKMYLCYLEYFQEGNGLLGCHLARSDRKICLQMLCLKKHFLVTELFVCFWRKKFPFYQIFSHLVIETESFICAFFDF